MLNSSGESGHPCLVPDFRVNAFNFSPLRIMFAVGLSYIAFIMLRYAWRGLVGPGGAWRGLVWKQDSSALMLRATSFHGEGL